MYHRSIQTVSRHRVAPQLARCLSAAPAAPASFKNANYDVEEHHRREVLDALKTDSAFRDSMAYSLSMATSEGSAFPPLSNHTSILMKDQLERSKTQLNSRIAEAENVVDKRPLPRTLEDALRPSSRAIVITDTTRPFRVRDVNKAWENLCGYTYLESRGKSLGALLAGPETDELAVSALLNQLMRGEDATAVLTNYTKAGRKFRNRLNVGPIFNEDGDITNFVGILQEVSM
eukprot:CAMPEP_0176082028 /NCGR_PEP_ID=MMETSP0120_2-20121206/41031_1 /TAXON_ID=160619 /ORGANISM="Kryptoperidinium foliaceum, Strain CCMP 1326" /LENGTH=231 /DNA_ID=CAMNT_0017415795 /DNA_START=133 /DNA_END=828 /DNA_ORIENTATION=+